MYTLPFENVNFIKSPGLPDRSASTPAILFRRKFTVKTLPNKAILSVCGLGYGYYYINGKSVTQDLFTAPVSDYRKTLWFTEYDVTSLLQEGENVAAVILGNGWYNEWLSTSWDYDYAPWRDKPKFILSLLADGERILVSDGEWLCSEDTPILYNELRSGETFDARRYNPQWKETSLDTSGWKKAISDTTPPTGVFRLCPCEGIQEDRILPAISVDKREENRYIFDIGQNISGYIRLSVTGEEGQLLEIRYAEKLTPDGEMEYHRMQQHYKNAEFALDRFICSGKPFIWSPKFTYHGFRYIEIRGLKEAVPSMVAGVFVHQAVLKKTGFRCSDEFLNRLFHAGQNATLSNLFYMPTDCPTREKLGWCNDAQSSCDQFLTDFTTERLLKKWLQDIYDAMLPDGALPGIIPSSGWGYGWGNGPVSEGILFEIPYRIYLHSGDATPLLESRPYFEKSLTWYESQRDENGEISYGLDDWTSPVYERMVKAPFVNELLLLKFLKIARLAAELAGDDDAEKVYSEQFEERKEFCRRKYIGKDGRCILHRQTAVAMLIYYRVGKREPLAEQLRQLVEENNFHLDCGMVGMRYIFPALNRCGLENYAFRLLTAEGFPSFRNWDEDGMTTLYETWNMKDSLNHHMFSCFMTWMTKTILGIVPTAPGSRSFSVEPRYFEDLSFAEGYRETPFGRLSVRWEKQGDKIHLEITVPDGLQVTHRGRYVTGKAILEE